MYPIRGRYVSGSNDLLAASNNHVIPGIVCNAERRRHGGACSLLYCDVTTKQLKLCFITSVNFFREGARSVLAESCRFYNRFFRKKQQQRLSFSFRSVKSSTAFLGTSVLAPPSARFVEPLSLSDSIVCRHIVLLTISQK